MQVIPRISGERLASLPAGARLSVDNQIITLNHCRGDRVNYTDARRSRQEYGIAITTASATERLDAKPRACCDVLDLKLTTIERYRRTACQNACSDRLCTRTYQSKQRTKQGQVMKKRIWRGYGSH